MASFRLSQAYEFIWSENISCDQQCLTLEGDKGANRAERPQSYQKIFAHLPFHQNCSHAFTQQGRKTDPVDPDRKWKNLERQLKMQWSEVERMRKGWPLLMHTFSVSLCPSTFSNTAPCSTNFTSPGGYIETPQQARSWYNTNVDCTYTVTVYMGYGVEIQVNSSHGAFVIEPVAGNDLNYCGNPVLLFYSWKVKCVISVPAAINRIAKNNDCFHTGFVKNHSLSGSSWAKSQPLPQTDLIGWFSVAFELVGNVLVAPQRHSVKVCLSEINLQTAFLIVVSEYEKRNIHFVLTSEKLLPYALWSFFKVKVSC